MAEEAITEEDVERMKRGFRLLNAGEFDELEQYVSPDVVVGRVGGMPPLVGWPALRENLEPDAFESQTIDPLGWEYSGNKALIHMRIHSVGAGSGLAIDTEGWMVWTVVDHLVTHMEAFPADGEAAARARFQ